MIEVRAIPASDPDLLGDIVPEHVEISLSLEDARELVQANRRGQGLTQSFTLDQICLLLATRLDI